LESDAKDNTDECTIETQCRLVSDIIGDKPNGPMDIVMSPMLYRYSSVQSTMSDRLIITSLAQIIKHTAYLYVRKTPIKVHEINKKNKQVQSTTVLLEM
jgi:hypothetical protein